MEGDGAEGPDAVGDGFVADGAEERGKFGRAEEAGYGVWQVFVRNRLAGNQAAYFWQDTAKIPAIEIP